MCKVLCLRILLDPEWHTYRLRPITVVVLKWTCCFIRWYSVNFIMVVHCPSTNSLRLLTTLNRPSHSPPFFLQRFIQSVGSCNKIRKSRLLISKASAHLACSFSIKCSYGLLISWKGAHLCCSSAKKCSSRLLIWQKSAQLCCSSFKKCSSVGYVEWRVKKKENG